MLFGLPSLLTLLAFDSGDVAMARVASSLPFSHDNDMWLKFSWVMELQCARQVEGYKYLEGRASLETILAAREHRNGVKAWKALWTDYDLNPKECLC